MNQQRRWQLKQKEAGKCSKCGKPAVTKAYCEVHRLYHLRWNAEYVKRNQYKYKKKEYDRIRKAKEDYGQLWEQQVLILEINDEIRKINAIRHESKENIVGNA